MTAKDLLDSNTAKNSKPAAGMTKAKNSDNVDKKKHMPCKHSLPT